MAGSVTTNYVIAAYMGDRMNPAPGYARDRTSLLRTHLQSLGNIHHNLDQVTLVVSGKPGTEEMAFLSQLPHWIRGQGTKTKLRVRIRPNVGMSYGAFSEAFDEWRDAFTHFIFTEDDYLFTRDHFEKIMLEELTARPTCGFLCGASYVAAPDTFRHAAVFIGMAPTMALAIAAELAGGHLPFDSKSPVPVCGFHGQKGMSEAIVNAGYTIDDWLCRWSTAYWDSEHSIVRWFSRDPLRPEDDPQGVRGDMTRPTFVVPAQALGGTGVKLSDGHEWHHGLITRTGEFLEAGQ